MSVAQSETLPHLANSTTAPLAISVVEVKAVTMEFRVGPRSFVALAPTDLRVNKGEFVSLLGPSGCGKTTLLRIISGLARPNAGVVRVNDNRVNGPQTSMGIVFQAPVLLEWMTVLDNVLLQAKARPIDKAAARIRALELLRRVGLEQFTELRPSQLSGGMQQRVALCRALLHEPDVVLMDEPFGALDSLTRDQMCLDLQRLWVGGEKTALFVTHDIAEAVFLSDRVLVMQPGPGRIQAEIEIDLPRPRRLSVRDQPEFIGYCRAIRRLFEAHGVLHDE